MITIKEISTGKEHDADKPLLPLWQQLCTNTGETSDFYDNDERNPNWIHLTRQYGCWTLNAGLDEHVFEPCILKPEEFQVIDTDYIAKVEVAKTLKDLRLLADFGNEFAAAEIFRDRPAIWHIRNIAKLLGIPLSQIE